MAVLGYLCTGLITALMMFSFGRMYTNWLQNEQINGTRKTSSSHRSGDDNGAKAIVSPPVVTTHDDQESADTSQIDMPLHMPMPMRTLSAEVTLEESKTLPYLRFSWNTFYFLGQDTG